MFTLKWYWTLQEPHITASKAQESLLTWKNDRNFSSDMKQELASIITSLINTLYQKKILSSTQNRSIHIIETKIQPRTSNQFELIYLN